jgi:hypothetical protein
MWWRSYRTQELFRWTNLEPRSNSVSEICLVFDRGSIDANYWTPSPPADDSDFPEYAKNRERGLEHVPVDADYYMERELSSQPVHGFLYAHDVNDLTKIVVFPFWFLAGLFAIAPILWGTRLATRLVIRKHRSAAGRCRVCGYDLRASTGLLCPECGATEENRRKRHGFD